MRALSPAATAAINAVITSPGHLVYLGLTPTPARWSDIGQVTLSDGTTWAAVDMKIGRMGFAGDSAPQGITLQLANLDSSIGALLLANDVASVPVHIQGFDRAALNYPADVAHLGDFRITQARIGIDSVSLTCAPVFYTAPFRRVDAPNGFTHATPAGTKITWGREFTILQQSRYWQWWEYPDG